MANSDTISIFPDPDAPDFEEGSLPKGVSGLMCRDARKKVGKGYHILGPTREGLFKKTMKDGLGVPEIMTRVYFDTCWHEYNIGLAKLTEPRLSKAPFEATGAGHLVHKDDPKLVAQELAEILDKLSLQEALSRI